MAKSDLSVAETVRRAREHLPEGKRLSAQSLSQYRHGRSLPKARPLQALAAVLGVKPEDLVGEVAMRETQPGPMVRAQGAGENARLRVDLEVPWTVALGVLQLLKAHEGTSEPPALATRDGRESIG